MNLLVLKNGGSISKISTSWKKNWKEHFQFFFSASTSQWAKNGKIVEYKICVRISSQKSWFLAINAVRKFSKLHFFSYFSTICSDKVVHNGLTSTVIVTSLFTYEMRSFLMKFAWDPIQFYNIKQGGIRKKGNAVALNIQGNSAVIF